jgi:hypothetical protein
MNEFPRIFISYSHRGNGLEWKYRLLSQLSVFEKQQLLDAWHDDETNLGDDWHVRINGAMQNAKLAVLLLTDEFLKSPFVLQHELPELQRRHKEDGLIVAPILCEKCDWEANTWLASLQIKPRRQSTPVPLATFPGTDDEHALRQIATEIAVQLGDAAVRHYELERSLSYEARTFLEKFPITRGPGLREEKLIGREQEIALLDLAFAHPHTAIVSLVAWGGVGKTMLVQHWLRRLQHENWRGVDQVYAWSFYSQGTKEDRQASEDSFLAHALEWFGVQCETTLSPWDKGRLLADAVLRERTLLILDGIEPLQYPPGPMGGQLRAPGVQSLLKHLARKAISGFGDQKIEVNNCLCLMTTREPLTDLSDFQRREGSPWGTVLRVDLGNLTDEAGAALLHHAGANRAGAAEIKSDDKELLAASREVDGHALTLNLLGRFLARAHCGNIRRRDLVNFEEADREEQGGTTFKMLAAFERWFVNTGEFGRRQLTILHMLSLFDRPADGGCIAALRQTPAISGLTDSAFTMSIDSSTGETTIQPLLEEDFNTAASFLKDFGLVEIFSYADNTNYFLDCHPLIREYFSTAIRMRIPESWESAHRRLYDHLKNSTEIQPDTIEGLDPLYRAVAHGCQAGLHEETFNTIYLGRILRGNKHYSWKRLRIFSSELTAVCCFFDEPWKSVVKDVPDSIRSFLLGHAAFCLQAVGRSAEAAQPLQAGLELTIRSQDWVNASIASSNLAELELILGDLGNAEQHAAESVDYIDQYSADHFPSTQAVGESSPAFVRVYTRAIWGYILHLLGNREKSFTLFREAEWLQSIQSPIPYPFLTSLQGYRFCDLMLSTPEREAWKLCILSQTHEGRCRDRGIEALRGAAEVERRATMDLMANQMMGKSGLIQDMSFCNLVLGRYAVCKGITADCESRRLNCLEEARQYLDSAVQGLRQAGNQDHIPFALLTRAWQRWLVGDKDGSCEDLDGAWQIAERGSMSLHMVDIHLYRARLFLRERPYPWTSPQDDFAAARRLIERCGYLCRSEELEDAEKAANEGSLPESIIEPSQETTNKIDRPEPIFVECATIMEEAMFVSLMTCPTCGAPVRHDRKKSSLESTSILDHFDITCDICNVTWPLTVAIQF